MGSAQGWHNHELARHSRGGMISGREQRSSCRGAAAENRGGANSSFAHFSRDEYLVEINASRATLFDIRVKPPKVRLYSLEGVRYLGCRVAWKKGEWKRQVEENVFGRRMW